MKEAHKNNPDYVYSSGGIMHLDTFFSYYMKDTGINKYDFLSMIEDMSQSRLVNYGTTINEDVLFYFSTLPRIESTSYGVVIYQWNPYQVEAQFRQYLYDYNGFISIFSDSGIPIFSVIDTDDSFTTDSWSELASIGENVMTKKGRYSLFKTESGSGYAYLMGLSTTQLFRNVNRYRTLMIGAYAVIIVTGGVFAFLFAVWFYGPIHRIAESLALDRFEDFKDEVKLISSSVTNISKENTRLKVAMNRGASALKRHFFMNLLQAPNHEVIETLLQYTGIEFHYSRYLVVIFALDQYMEMDDSHKSMFTFNLAAVGEELSREEACGISEALVDINAVALLINAQDEITEKASRIAGSVLSFFSESFDIELFAVVGPRCDSLAGIGGSFQKAKDLMKYRMYYPDRNIILCDEFTEKYIGDYQYPFEGEDALFKAIYNGDSIETRKQSIEIVDFLKRQKIEPELVRGIYVSVFNNLIKNTVPEGIANFEDIRRDISRFIVESFSSMGVMADKFVDIMIRVALEMESVKKSDGARLADALRSAVAGRYADPNLSLKVFEAEYGLSASYLTRTFKNHMGITLKEYLDTIRLDRAKSLLTGSDDPLEKIITEIGYTDVSNFCRKFKHDEGITPLQYRRLHSRGLRQGE